MSKADKMFEELGYEKVESDDLICYHFRNYIKIFFHIKLKSYYSCYSNGDSLSIYADEHKAIHEKMKELGWL